MNPLKQLQRRYDRLKEWERIPLLLAAEGRGDDDEYDRLRRTAPRTEWTIPDIGMAEQALNILSYMFAVQQLETASTFFFMAWNFVDDKGELAEETLLALEACNYFYSVNALAWTAFCKGLGIDPATLVKANHHSTVIEMITEGMLRHAPTREDYCASVAARGKDPNEIMTVESRTEYWRDWLRDLTKCTPVPESLLR